MDKGAAAQFEELFKLPGMVLELTQQVHNLKDEISQLRSLMPPRLYTVKEAAGLLKVSQRTVRRRLEDGTLRLVRVGENIRVDLSHLMLTVTKEQVVNKVFSLNT